MKPEVRAHFVSQADACERMGSPFTARLCRILPTALNEATVTGRRVLNWRGDPRADALALRLCGGLHYLVMKNVDLPLTAIYPPADDVSDEMFAAVLDAAILRQDTALDGWLDSAPQTNEVARSGMLLPGFLAIARETQLPLAIHEIGASAGLNLLLDRFHYRYGAAEWGDPDSPVSLAPEVRGDIPSLDGALAITARDGCDLFPIDTSDTEARLRLRAFVWADQEMRLARLRGALDLAAETPPKIEACGAADFVRRKLEQRQQGEAFVLFHSIMWQYMPSSEQAEIIELTESAGETATAASPVFWLRMEPDDTRDPHAMLTLTKWPDAVQRTLARCDYHGRWIEWINGAAG